MNDTEAVEYAVTIQMYYEVLQRRFVTLSVSDWITIEGWHRLAIPIECVLKGMDRAFSRQHVYINSLEFCDRSVKDVSAKLFDSEQLASLTSRGDSI